MSNAPGVIDDIFPKWHLTAVDILEPKGVLVTVKGWKKLGVWKQAEMKEVPTWCLLFEEYEKPYVGWENTTNREQLAKIFEDRDTANWVDKSCVMYVTTARFAGDEYPVLRFRSEKVHLSKTKFEAKPPVKQVSKPVSNASDTPDKPAPFPSKLGDPTAFWTYARGTAKIDDDAALKLLADNGGDFDKALLELQTGSS